MSADRMVSVYRALLTAYPRQFRGEYGEDMIQVLRDQLRGQPLRRQTILFARALADLAHTAVREHMTPAVAPAAAAAGGGGTTAPAPDLRRTSESPTRRDFLRASLAVTGIGLGASVGGASLAYLWPSIRGGFGALVDVGSEAEVTEGIRTSGGTYAVPAARAYLVAYDPADDPDGLYAEVTAGTAFMALYQRCVHLGCRVPWCVASTRFECPCHKSRYNRWGEYQDGPAPRGLDRFAVWVVDGQVLVDTRAIVTGPARTGGVLAEGPTGPSCL